jgi:hypothetical protein
MLPVGLSYISAAIGLKDPQGLAPMAYTYNPSYLHS